MMLDRLFAFFHRPRLSPEPRDRRQGDGEDPVKARRRRQLEEREHEARRMNDALEDIVQTMRPDGER